MCVMSSEWYDTSSSWKEVKSLFLLMALLYSKRKTWTIGHNCAALAALFTREEKKIKSIASLEAFVPRCPALLPETSQAHNNYTPKHFGDSEPKTKQNKKNSVWKKKNPRILSGTEGNGAPVWVQKVSPEVRRVLGHQLNQSTSQRARLCGCRRYTPESQIPLHRGHTHPHGGSAPHLITVNSQHMFYRDTLHHVPRKHAAFYFCFSKAWFPNNKNFSWVFRKNMSVLMKRR